MFGVNVVQSPLQRLVELARTELPPQEWPQAGRLAGATDVRAYQFFMCRDVTMWNHNELTRLELLVRYRMANGRLPSAEELATLTAGRLEPEHVEIGYVDVTPAEVRERLRTPRTVATLSIES